MFAPPRSPILPPDPEPINYCEKFPIIQPRECQQTRDPTVESTYRWEAPAKLRPSRYCSTAPSLVLLLTTLSSLMEISPFPSLRQIVHGFTPTSCSRSTGS